MFRDLKSNVFNMEGTWTKNLIYLCLCIAYTRMIISGSDRSKNKKSKIIGAAKKIKNKTIRVYILFSSGLTWFNGCYDSHRKKCKLKFNFILYDV